MLSPQMQYHLFPYKPTSNKVILNKFHTKCRTSFILTVLFYRAQASTVQQQVNCRGDQAADGEAQLVNDEPCALVCKTEPHNGQK